MEALGALSPLDVIEGKIQGKVGTFLSLKAPINTMRQHPSLQIKEQAAGLFASQRLLEKELTETLDRIEHFKSGAWTYGDVISIGSFAARMTQQVNKVQSLQRQANVQGPITDPGIMSIVPELPLWAWGIGGIVALRMLRIL